MEWKWKGGNRGLYDEVARQKLEAFYHETIMFRDELEPRPYYIECPHCGYNLHHILDQDDNDNYGDPY